MTKTFECFLLVEMPRPHNLKKWMSSQRDIVFAARDSLLAQNPGRRVVRQFSRCIGRKHRRFPANAPERYPFGLLYRVTLDKPVRDGE